MERSLDIESPQAQEFRVIRNAIACVTLVTAPAAKTPGIVTVVEVQSPLGYIPTTLATLGMRAVWDFDWHSTAISDYLRLGPKC